MPLIATKTKDNKRGAFYTESVFAYGEDEDGNAVIISLTGFPITLKCSLVELLDIVEREEGTTGEYDHDDE